MKKILLVLICVLCGVGIAYSQGTVTVHAYANINEKSKTNLGGGEVIVHAQNMNKWANHEWITDINSSKLVKLFIDNLWNIQTINLPVELVFYFFLFYQIQLNYENAKGKIEIARKLLELEINLEQFINLPSILKLNQITQGNIEQIISQTVSQINQQDDFKYIMVINIFNYISYPINEELIKEQFKELCQKLEISNINLSKFTPAFQILLRFVDSLNLQNKFIYLNIFTLIMEKISGPNGNEKHQNYLLTWIVEKILNYNIHLSCLS